MKCKNNCDRSVCGVCRKCHSCGDQCEQFPKNKSIKTIYLVGPFRAANG